MIERLDNIKINSEIRQTPSWRRLSVIIAAVILSLIMLPSFQAVFEYRLLRWLAVLSILWLIIIFLERPGSHFLGTRFTELIVYTAWCGIVAIYALTSPPDQEVSSTMGSFTKVFYTTCQISMCYLIGLRYAEENNRDTFNWLVSFLCFSLGINALLSMPALLNADFVVREYINTYQQIEGQRPGLSYYCLGSLGLYTAEAMLSPLFLALALEAKGIKRIAYWVSLTGIVGNIFLSSLLVPTLVLIISITVYTLITMTRRRISWKRRISIIAFITLITIIGFYLGESKPMQYSIGKAYYLINPSYHTPEGSHSIDERQILYMQSIETFMKFPFFGAGAEQVAGEIGGHSGIFDGLAMYGILFSPYLVFLWIKYRHLRAILKRKLVEQWPIANIIIFISYLILITVDPLIFNAATSGVFFLVIGSVFPITKLGSLPLKRYL